MSGTYVYLALELGRVPRAGSVELHVVSTQGFGKEECVSEKRERLRSVPWEWGIWGWAQLEGWRGRLSESEVEMSVPAATGGGV